MALRKSQIFLPEVFKTARNEKFLNATVDQLISEPRTQRLNGFIGRKFARNFTVGDSYLNEISTERQSYQLEPGVVYRNSEGRIESVSSIIDFLNSVRYWNGDTTDPNDLFKQEYYNWSSFVDFDKLVNYGEYFWLPGGPDRVNVFGTSVDSTEDYTVFRDNTIYSDPVYRFNNTTATSNETLYLARGGTYTFTVNQPGIPFWIQSEIGLSGVSSSQQNLSTRNIIGVTNNGEDVGTITFNVPLKDDQSDYAQMTKTADVDFASDLSYSQIHNQVYSKFIDDHGGIDTFTEINGKTLVFINQDDNEELWEQGSPYDAYTFDETGTTFDASVAVPLADRYDIFTIEVKSIGGVDTITLTRTLDFPRDTKVKIKQGKVYGNKEYYKTASGYPELISYDTASLDTLFYQDGNDALSFGRIIFVDTGDSQVIDLTNDVLGKENYTSPNGVRFTNGLKVEFDTTVTPASYQNNIYYVEGVGTSISLVAVDSLTTPEPFTENEEEPYDSVLFDTENYDGSSNNPTLQDYIVANRSCIDNNAWARGNRWFHRQVIEDTAEYNNFNIDIDDTARAKRPIIEFIPNLQLFNYGIYSVDPVSVVDTTQTDALSNVAGQTGYFCDGVALLPQMTVIFSADPDIKDKIFRVDFIDEDADSSTAKIINLVEIGTVADNTNVVSNLGSNNQGKVFVYKNSTWNLAQQKTAINQEPLFDVFDGSHRSFSDTSVYPTTTFTGSKLFSYKRNSSAATDQVLQFGLTYNNFDNIGDIVFENNYITDTFNYTKDKALVKVIVKSGHVHYHDEYTNARTLLNGWTTVIEESKQYQIRIHQVVDELYSFEIGAEPANPINTVSLQVFVNGEFQTPSKYTVLDQNDRHFVVFDNALKRDDTVTLRVYSTTVIDGAYFEVAKNIENNADNQDFSTFTLGQVRNHLIDITRSIPDFTGTSLGSNNVRDLDYKKYPGKILQHSAGAILPQYMLNNPDVNAVESLIYSMEEYTRFKNRFIDNIEKLDLDYTDIPKCVDDILLYMTNNKTSSFPFYYSDMIPWGSLYTTVNLTVDDAKERVFEFSTQFDLTSVSSRGVIIYHIRGQQKTQLLEAVEYTFDTVNSQFTLSTNFSLQVGDKFEIKEYTNTDGSFVPPTPTKLGLWKKYTPRKYIDNTYSIPKEVLQGHDGSVWVTYGDVRDDVLLEFEKRVYNNIKTQYRSDLVDIDSILSGFWRTDPLTTLSSELAIIRSLYGRWALKNRVDITANTTYDSENTFTWNYANGITKTDGLRMPGFWRGIYHWLYGTDTPHLTPWEMLGHSQKPSWWDDRYGVAPYTRGNSVLWEDIRDGKIYTSAIDDTYTTNTVYARPDLMDNIPVNDQGTLRSPAEFAIIDVTSLNSADTWAFGDQSPQETGWRRSSEWPFAVQLIALLKSPAKYLSLMFDTNLYDDSTTYQQKVQTDKSYRPALGSYYIHGVELSNSTEVHRIEGYNQFLYNFATNKGINLTDVQTRIRNLELNLVYPLSGYSDKEYLKVVAENATPSSSNQTIFVPDEDYEIILHKSQPLERVQYSGVKIIKVNNGFKLEGYDTENPFFRIIPSARSENSTTITVGGRSLRIFKDFKKYTADVPYGITLSTQGQVVDFLNAYQRYLNSKGVRFETTNEKGSPLDFILGAKEFMFWCDQNWTDKNVIALSPAYHNLEVDRRYTTTDDFTKGAKLKDQNNKPIRPVNFNVSRVDNLTTITTNPDINCLCSASISPIQYEHYMVFNNQTIFNDILYQPELGNRQDRMKLIGFKAGDWNGTLHAPGFIFNNNEFEIWQENKDYKKGDYVSFRDTIYAAKQDHAGKNVFEFKDWVNAEYMKTGLLPNIANKADQFKNFFEVDALNLEIPTDKAGKGLIGFRSREYLENLGLDDVSQVKFYQGLLKTKGTSEGITKLVGADLTNVDQQIDFYEEWGFRVGEYGSIDSNQVIDIQVVESQAQNNPVVIELVDNGDPINQDYISVKEKNLIKVPNEYSKNFLGLRGSNTLINDLNSAGFARLDDVDYTSWSNADLPDLNSKLNELGRGKKIWVARSPADETSAPDWNIYRVSETGIEITNAVSSTNGFITFTTTSNHGFVKTKQVIIKSNDVYAGFHEIVDVPQPNKFVVFADSIGEVERENLREPIFVLENSRFDDLASIVDSTPKFGWNKNELVWIDQDSNGKWSVYKKDEPWAKGSPKDLSRKIADAKMGHSITVGRQGVVSLAGAPDDGTGTATFLVIDEDKNYIATTLATLADFQSLLDGFGTSVAVGNNYAAIGAPDSNSSKGYVSVWQFVGDGTYLDHQILNVNGISTAALYGTQVKISSDDRYLFVSAPGTNTVYVYALVSIPTAKQQVYEITGNASNTTFTLDFTPISIESIRVKDGLGKTYVPYVDYTLSDADITFTSGTPASGLKIVVRERDYYAFVDSFSGSDSVTGDKFGESIDIDNSGRTIVVGAPYAEVANSSSTVFTDAGEAYVFSMSVEVVTGNGTTKSFTTETALPTKFFVEVDGVLQILTTITDPDNGDGSSLNYFSVSGNTITFRYTPSAGSVIRIFTGDFKEVQKIDQNLTGETPTDGENFGRSVAIDAYGSIIAVGSPGEDELNPNTGSVFLFADTGMKFGNVTNDTGFNVTSGDTIYVDDYKVTMSSTTSDPAKLVADIDNTNIPGVVSELASGNCKITSSSIQANQLVRVRPGTGVSFVNSELKPFRMVQKIDHPAGYENENFGTSLAFNKFANNSYVSQQELVIGSDRASTPSRTRYDLDTDTTSITYGTYTTTFDNSSTKFIDRKIQSGAVYTFEQLEPAGTQTLSNPFQYGFIQNLQSDSMSNLDQFGYSVAYMDNKILVGSRLDDTSAVNSGTIYEFTNATRDSGWKLFRSEAEKVDVNLINRAVLYNSQLGEITNFLDYIDPFKGKLVGQASDELDFITPYDPASYTISPYNTSGSSWDNERIGRVWWDLNTCSILEYEQGDLDYRVNYWGRFFPGSSIDVHEWVESDVLPSEYVLAGYEGIPKHEDDSHYSTSEQFLPATNSTITKYYFWVKDKLSLPEVDFRNISTNQVAQLIEDPKAQGIKFASFLSQNAISLTNIKNNISGDNTILSVNYDVVPNEHILHSEFELVSEGDSEQIIPNRIWNKIVDSISGTDITGQIVPDPFLSETDKYGIATRPRQSLYKNRRMAIKILVDFCNKVFATIPIVRQSLLTGLSAAQAQPTSASGEWDKKLANILERDYLNLQVLSTGYNVLVESDETLDNNWAIYTLTSTKTWSLVKVQSFNTASYWSYKTWYATGYSSTTIPDFQVDTEPGLLTLNSTVGQVAKVLSNDEGNFSFFEYQGSNQWREVIIERGTIELRSNLYDYTNNNLTENTGYDIDIFDFSYFDNIPNREIREILNAVKTEIFTQNLALYINQLFFRLIEYSLSEDTGMVDWVFKSSFIKVKHKLRDLEQYPTFKNDNTQFIESYIEEVKPYKTKIREYITKFGGNDTFSGDVTDFDVHAFYDDTLDYFRKPSGDYAGDELLWSQGLNKPWSENYSYKIGSLEIIAAGSGYIVDPTITISVPDLTSGVQATARAVTNSSSIVQVIITNKGSGYTTTPTVTVTGAGTGCEIVARIENDTNREFDVTLKFDRFTYSSIVQDWSANTSYEFNDLIAYKNTTTGVQEVYKCIVTGGFTSGSTFSVENASNTVVLEIYPDELLANNADRIAAYYTPSSGMIGDDLNLLQIGTDYTSNRVSGAGFDLEPGFDSATFDTLAFDDFEVDLDGLVTLSGASTLDTIIKSTFADLALGTRPEDINIDGGDFVDVYSSHAPEEFIPGAVFDTLDIEVYTDPSNDFQYNGNSFDVVTKVYVSDGTTDTFGFASSEAKEDVDFIRVWIGSTPQRNITVDYFDRTFTLPSIPAAGSTIYVYGFGVTGEKMSHEETFIGDGSTASFICGIPITYADQQLVLKNGIQLVKDTDYTINPSDNRVLFQFTDVPANGDHIHIFIYDQDTSRQAWTEVYTQEISLTSGTYVYNLDKTIQFAQPLAGNVVVELGNERLRPTNAKHYTADGSTVTYTVPTTAGELATIADGDIRVTVISPDDRSTLNPATNKIPNIDYLVNASDGSSARTISFFDPPSTGDTVIVSVQTGAEYAIDSNLITLDSATSFTTGDKLYVTSFANHDPLRIQTKVFEGIGSSAAEVETLFDADGAGFDSVAFDAITTTGIVDNKYTLDRNITNSAYLWVTLNGLKLHAGEYSIVAPNQIDLSGQTLDANSVIVVTSFSENVIEPTVGFRIFNDMLGDWEYRRIAKDNKTILSRDLLPTDTKIYVEDANRLPYASVNNLEPGVVYIGSERVTYWEISYEDNYISNIRRGTSGTAFTPIHRKGIDVVDGGLDQALPATDTHTKVWYDQGSGTAANGLGIQSATTTNAKFLKDKEASVGTYLRELDSPRYLDVNYVEEGYVEVR